MVNRRLLNVLLIVALVGTSALVLLLSRRLDALGEEYRELRLLTSLPHAGYVVPTFRAETLRGDSVTVGEAADSSRRQMLFVFNTTCPYCQEIIPVWRGLADSVSRLGAVEVFGISLHPADSTRGYVSRHALPYPVVLFPQAKLKRLFRATSVPQTVVLDAYGSVLYAKTGLVNRASMDSIYAAASKSDSR